MRTLYLAIAVALATVLLGSCSSHNTITTDGKIAGSINVDGPFNGAAELNVGVFQTGDTPVQSAVAGRITSATATLTGREITFSFTDLPLGSYTVRLYSTGPGGNTYYYQSSPVVLDSTTSEVNNFTADASFTGAGPFGSISGVVILSDDFEFPTGGKLAFLGFSPASAPQNAYQAIVTEADASSGQLYFNETGIAHGQWIVGLYGYDPTTHEVSVFGMLDTPITVGDAAVTGAVFGADSDGDPGTDPALGTISGTLTFNGTIPADQYIAIAANTIPPQQGAPPSTLDVLAADVAADRSLDFTLPLLPDGTYSVSIFSYDISTHQAVYFGEYSGSVVIDASHQDVTGIDFTADVTTIGGTAD